MTDEEKTIKEDEKTGAAGDNEEGSKPETDSIVERASAAADRIEKANKEMSENLRRQEELEARRALGGKSEGKQPEKKDEEVTPDKIKGDLEKVGW